jgi:hypothetical protein
LRRSEPSRRTSRDTARPPSAGTALTPASWRRPRYPRTVLTPEEDQARRARARECAVELLELSRVYENVIVPPGCPVEWPIVVAIVARQRSHLKAVIQLADAGLALEAEAVDRMMFEFSVRLKWLLLDVELNRPLWLRDDIQRRFTIDRETREWAEANDREIEILRPDVRESLERTRDQIDARLDELAGERGLDRRPTYPGLEQQATATGNRIDYALGYRLNSQGAAHPNVMALQNLIRELPDDGGLQVLAEPAPENRLNVYGTGAVYLFDALDVAGELIPRLRIDGLDEVGQTLTELAIMRIDAERRRAAAD